ncbi:hypothetical protein B9Z65_3167 [Elsinoe australis]|uniref:Exosome complex component CSL4 C-terminal domain-containing protein n=1 Tax=Elsinoe australis TaxID=40998 RepID=A0A2P7ZUL3_9PEZI|nr:hypothetical protein B9Z65_3167 [Elsinoe australis]
MSGPNPQILLPGDPLPPAPPSLGTHLFSTTLTSSLAGTHHRSKTTTSVRPPHPASPSLPSTGDIILGRITRITSRQATLDILTLTSLPSTPGPSSASSSSSATASSTLTSTAPSLSETVPLPYAHQALIRAQDIRATEIDKVSVAGSFQVGDIVRAAVISVGDERNYYCSTARDELGVVLGRSETGRDLVGVSWREMVEVFEGRVGKREGRKVGRVI